MSVNVCIVVSFGFLYLLFFMISFFVLVKKWFFFVLLLLDIVKVFGIFVKWYLRDNIVLISSDE